MKFVAAAVLFGFFLAMAHSGVLGEEDEPAIVIRDLLFPILTGEASLLGKDLFKANGTVLGIPTTIELGKNKSRK